MIAVLHATMGGMAMPGGSAMAMAWTRMPTQTWLGAAAAFLGMWLAMMAAMMLPSMAPVLWRYRRSVDTVGRARAAGLTALVGAGYLFLWAVLGMIVFPLGVSLAALARQLTPSTSAVAMTTAVVIIAASALQFTAWKAHHLACWREAPEHGRSLPASAGTAWRHGLRLGVHCSSSSAGLTMVLLVLGAMDLRMMAMVTMAITAERLAPASLRVTPALGAAGVGAGLLLIARAAGAT